MLKEQDDLVGFVGNTVTRLLTPVSQILVAIGRLNYLQIELQKVIPQQKPELVKEPEKEEKKDA